MHTFTDLIIWQKSRELVKTIYQLSKSFPKEELYCLRSQIQRAAISVPLNISEGAGRSTNLDFCRFLDIATGSL